MEFGRDLLQILGGFTFGFDFFHICMASVIVRQLLFHFVHVPTEQLRDGPLLIEGTFCRPGNWNLCHGDLLRHRTIYRPSASRAATANPGKSGPPSLVESADCLGQSWAGKSLLPCREWKHARTCAGRQQYRPAVEEKLPCLGEPMAR